jgi:ABC-type cobalamin/Fe3+-siderophores transport system ATPase subunit
MSFDLKLPQVTGELLDFPINMGDKVFVMGANGTGKSSLMQWLYRFYFNNSDANVRWISAHRQNWFSSNTMDFSPQQKRDQENNIRVTDINLDARWRDYGSNRAGIAIYDFIDSDNTRNRAIATAYEKQDVEAADTASKKDNLIKIMNELLRLSNISINISLEGNDKIVATKLGSNPYSIAELSDGERNAFLIAANVLTAKSNSVVLIDEPERHLHRSIISPLLTHLFSKRQDCVFIISTHDVMLALDNPSARILLIRGCTYQGSSVSGWDVNIVPPGAEIDYDIKKDILGARRKILFIEGEEGRSLDKPLYSLIFPNVSIIPKSNCWNVEHTVSSIRAFESEHWVDAFGIVDNDRRPQNDINELKEKGIYALSVISVESIYYHPHIQHFLAQRQANVRGDDFSIYLNNAKSAAIKEIRSRIQDLSTKTAEKAIRKEFFDNLPEKEGIKNLEPINVSIDVAKLVNEESERLQNALDAGDLLEIISRYPIRRSPALDKIAKELKFQDRNDYQAAVRKLLIDEPEALNFVKSLFGTLSVDINAV